MNKMCSFKPALCDFSTADIYSIKTIWTRTFLKNIQNISQEYPEYFWWIPTQDVYLYEWFHCVLVCWPCETVPPSLRTVHNISLQICLASITSRDISQNIKTLGRVPGCGDSSEESPGPPRRAARPSQASQGQTNSMWNQTVRFWVLSGGHTSALLQTTLTVRSWLKCIQL